MKKTVEKISKKQDQTKIRMSAIHNGENPNKIAPGNYKCGSKLCQNCDIISLENEFTDRCKNKHVRPILIWIATVIV